jgi:Fic family protein
MLFTLHQALGQAEQAIVARIEDTWRQLHHRVRYLRGWKPLLLRPEVLALAAAAVDDRDPEADRKRWDAVAGYLQAMDYALQRCGERGAPFSREVLMRIHFLIMQYDPAAGPGRFRPGRVRVRSSATGETLHEGINREHLDGVLAELVDALNAPSPLPILVRAAMAHLNLVVMHPFSDGNGRTGRCIQTALLARAGIVAPELSSIEEYIACNQGAYYAALDKVSGGRWAPERDARPWLRFCLAAHNRQARTFLRRAEALSAAGCAPG